MLTPDQQDFYIRWLQKADNIHDGDIASLIDKYVTLFINYNFLYNIIPTKIALETGEVRQNVSDKAGASTSTIDFLRAEVIANHLTEQAFDIYIDQLANAMPHFNINLKRGVPQPKVDELLIKDLHSNNAYTKVLAITKTLYSIRCNIVHGEKGLHQYQEMLLLPAIQLLRGLVLLVYEKINT